MSREDEDAIERLLGLIRTLRGENGCPWDRAQKIEDILSDLIEEAYELDWASRQRVQELFEELGDVLFLVCFAVAIQNETDPRFTIARLAQHAHDKIYRRHPHVFGDAKAETPDESIVHWERIKSEERAGRKSDADAGAGAGAGLFDDVAGNLPPMRRAEKVQERAASVGFDWDDVSGIVAKLREEIGEVEESLSSGSRDQVREELGDLLFSAINLTRFLNVDASSALNATTAKFMVRFRRMEELIRADGRQLAAMTLDEMDVYWERAKK
jgi:tetrapyrrole methylase family protein/MazG family protein